MSSYFETELQNILQQMINEYDTRTSTSARTRNTTTSSRRQTTDYNQQILDMLKQIITDNRYIMIDHREAMNNASIINMEILRTIQSISGQINRVPTQGPVPTQEPVPTQGPTQEPVPVQGPVPTSRVAQRTVPLPTPRVVPRTEQVPRRQTYDYLFTYLLHPPAQNNLQNVIVRPTTEQINNATEIITYNSNNNNINTQCPITLDEFHEGEILCRIIECQHTFREPAIKNWFRTNVRCPVCRFDIRDYVEEEENERHVQAPLQAQAQAQSNNQNLSNTITSNIANIIQSYLQNDISNTSMYDIFYDTSGNLLEMTIENNFDMSVD